MQYQPAFATQIKIKYLTFIAAIILYLNGLNAQNQEYSVSLTWKNIENFKFSGATYASFYMLENGSINENAIPEYYQTYNINGLLPYNVLLEPINTTRINSLQLQNAGLITDKIKYEWHVGYECGKPKLIITVQPLYKNGNSVYLINNLKISFQAKPALQPQNVLYKNFKANSVLATGKWYRVATVANSMHRIDYGFLKSIGINPDNLDPRNIQLWGKGAGMQPTPNNAPRIDDLEQIPIKIIGEEDGKFNINDILLFYGQSQLNDWNYNNLERRYFHSTNLYADTVYYYLTVANTSGKRIQIADAEGAANLFTNEQDYLFVYENEQKNLIKSGKVWVGEEFDRVTTQQFNFTIPFFVNTKPVKLNSSVTARTFVPGKFTVKLNGTEALLHLCAAVSASYDGPYTSGLNYQTATISLGSANVTAEYTFDKPLASSIGWLDYFEVHAKSELRNISGNFVFRNEESVGSNNITQFNINTGRNLTIWDVTNPVFPFEIKGSFNLGNFNIAVKTDSLRTFAAFDGSNYAIPKFAGEVANQNLHGLPFAEIIIITPNAFYNQALRLAAHHKATQNLNAHVIDIQQVYNEFSNGVQDITAIRELMRMFYKRATAPSEKPKYLILMGRASYDYKKRISSSSTIIPTFQSYQSFVPTSSYCSDDFFGFLDDNEGRWDIDGDNAEMLDIGIGRLPAANEEQMKNIIDKILNYTSAEAKGDWRNRITFVADDEDNNLHQGQSDKMANNVAQNKWLNIDKVFVDAYRELTVAGGKRNYDAQNAIVRAVDRGCLIVNYTGHGGEIGWSKKRILEMQDIKNWKNKNTLPLFITATCEFSRFDDPARQAAGEEILLNAQGGGIALFTTVRLVFSFSNDALNNKFYEFVGFDSLSLLNPPLLGDILKNTKNGYPDRNTRNFTLLGDPVLMLAYPKNLVKTVSINNKPVNGFNDTLKALSRVTISGVVTDRQGNVKSNYNGDVYPTVYDKLKTYQTIGNNSTSPVMDFTLQNSVIYKGRATVKNGLFSFSFIMPKDINYNVGLGKISYYVSNVNEDGTGYDNTILIGGTADSVNTDNTGPRIKLYLNDEKFVNGSLTNQNPVLIAKLFDENGINTTGQGVGRDISGVLNNDNAKSISLNDYFTGDLDTYQSGTIKYNLKDLPAGNHTLKLRAFDVFNNPSEQSVEFVVANSEQLALKHVLNYPNPFNNFTTFHFDHNKPNEQLDILIQVFTISGKLVKSLYTTSNTAGTHFDGISWNGTDDYGDKLANGVYLYKVNVKPLTGKTLSQFQKLVIFN